MIESGACVGAIKAPDDFQLEAVGTESNDLGRVRMRIMGWAIDEDGVGHALALNDANGELWPIDPRNGEWDICYR